MPTDANDPLTKKPQKVWSTLKSGFSPLTVSRKRSSPPLELGGKYVATKENGFSSEATASDVPAVAAGVPPWPLLVPSHV